MASPSSPAITSDPPPPSTPPFPDSRSTTIDMPHVSVTMPGHGRTGSFSFARYFTEEKPRAYEKEVPISKAINGSELIREREKHSSTFGERDAGLAAWNQVPAWIPIVCWIALSSGVILMNKWILFDLGFSFPIFLTTLHLAFQTLASRVLRRQTNLVDGARELEMSGRMNRDSFIKKIVPIGLLFSFSLVLSNWVYLRLTVSFIQMIKAVTPVVVLLISFALKIKQSSSRLLSIVCIISLGVGIASYGEIDFEPVGFAVQLLAIIIESTRLVLIQLILTDWSMSPLVSLYYFAPVCLFFNCLMVLPIEGFAPLYQIMEIGPFTLLLNASLTFLLNLSSVWLIGKASGLVLTLSGVLKDILLIMGSWAILGSTITGTQMFGYAIAIAGLVVFKTRSS